jgi:class III poly(R)-hydroxyalkanoic acid synthase PhaE subunit
MTDQAAFTQAWTDAQQQFWKNWMEMGQTAMKQQGITPNWEEGMALWLKNIEALIPAENRDTFQRFVEQGKHYFQFNEALLKNLQSMSAGNAGPEQWQQFWEQTLAGLRSNMGQFTNLGGFYDPIQQWQKFASSTAPMPGMDWMTGSDWMKNFANMPGMSGMPNMGNMGNMGNWQEQAQKMLGMPGVGYTREWQEDMQKMARLWMEHQQASQEYAEALSKVGSDTVNRLQSKLMSLTGSENPVSTLRELYDLWVDCAEDAYAELVNSDEYSQINARLVNTLMAYKQQARRMIDDTLGMMNMPTRRELDSVHKRLHDVKKQQNAAPDVSGLQAEVAALRQELAELKAANPEPAPRKTTTTRSTTSKKTSTSATK